MPSPPLSGGLLSKTVRFGYLTPEEENTHEVLVFPLAGEGAGARGLLFAGGEYEGGGTEGEEELGGSPSWGGLLPLEVILSVGDGEGAGEGAG